MSAQRDLNAMPALQININCMPGPQQRTVRLSLLQPHMCPFFQHQNVVGHDIQHGHVYQS